MFLPLWLLLLLCSILFFSTATLLQRVLLRNEKSDPKAYSILFQLSKGALILVFLFVKGTQFHSLAPVLISLTPRFIAEGILYGFGTIFLFEGLKRCEASEATILFASRAIWAVFGAIFLLGEHFLVRQVFGTILVLTSVILVTKQIRTFQFKKGEMLVLLAAILYGIAFVNDVVILKHIDATVYAGIGSLIIFFILTVVFPKSFISSLRFLNKPLAFGIIGMSIVYAFSSILQYYSYQIGNNAAQNAVIFQTSTIVTVILGIIFLKETATLAKKIIAAMTSVVGVLLVK